ncbi:GGDEF domain-containing protein [Undibacterium sp. LX40W]|uniref:diguanylate cyclase n=1 Tax=Undibacterium nitidum TaxID=2762298 RepID=A0A923HU25_9BURK|nr:MULTISPECIES: GGDEF domain-containing protein [Undibacterium]MBC3883385.1 GGDEF domain-containing protein [Undibacterium nitidum]MBC3893667.1 GGDEF domain-containing protein [Undibacterium sp. LX40W]
MSLRSLNFVATTVKAMHMARNTKQTIPFAQQQLLEAIAQIKEGGIRDDVLPKLEAVMNQLQTLATHDHLTGALNRNTFIERLDNELQRSKRTGHTFTVALIGVDRLPEIMEQYGQDVTKRILQVLTNEAGAVLRSLDSFGRVGATEFAIVMPTTWLDQSLVAIKRLKARMQAYAWTDLAPGLQISFSTGLTPNAPGDAVDKVLSRASDALQKARAQGYDTIVQVDAELPDFDPTADD